jgi:hypothetical protein
VKILAKKWINIFTCHHCDSKDYGSKEYKEQQCTDEAAFEQLADLFMATHQECMEEQMTEPNLRIQMAQYRYTVLPEQLIDKDIRPPRDLVEKCKSLQATGIGIWTRFETDPGPGDTVEVSNTDLDSALFFGMYRMKVYHNCQIDDLDAKVGNLVNAHNYACRVASIPDGTESRYLRGEKAVLLSTIEKLAGEAAASLIVKNVPTLRSIQSEWRSKWAVDWVLEKGCRLKYHLLQNLKYLKHMQDLGIGHNGGNSRYFSFATLNAVGLLAKFTYGFLSSAVQRVYSIDSNLR